MVKKVIISVFILFGVALMLYPWVSDYLFQRQAQSKVAVLKDKEKSLSEQERDEMLSLAEEYNENLRQSQVQLTDPFVETEQNQVEGLDYDSLLNLDGTGLMGNVEVPSIGVNLPIFHGTSPSTLEKGIGHLQGSSLPIGGESTHSVLTGHTGLNNAKLFTDLTEVKKGDVFLLHVLGRDLAYKVYDISVVKPDETEKLMIVPEKDLVTLVTCTPYGLNTHRLFVTGERTDYTSAKDRADHQDNRVKDSQWMRSYRIAAAIGTLISVLIILINRFFIGRKNRKGNGLDKGKSDFYQF